MNWEYSMYIFCFIILAIAIYRGLTIKLNTPYDYMKKSRNMVSMFRAYDYANKLLEEALQKFDNLADEEEAFINFQIGTNHYQKKRYKEAVLYFDKAWNFLEKENIPYSKAYEFMIKANLNIGEREKAGKIYKALRKKEVYDLGFAKLQHLEKDIWRMDE